MPAINMAGVVAANPSAGHAILMCPFSGPKGSPLDAKVYAPSTTTVKTADANNLSTGALNTGIGFGPDVDVPGITTAGLKPGAAPGAANGFTDDYQPGISMPSGASLANTPLATGLYGAVLTAIGGGKSSANTVATPSVAAPYNVQPLLAFGNGGSRDAGAGPAFTGFGTKTVTAVAPVANAAVIETGWVNRSGVTIPTGASQFGSATAASPVVS